MGVISFLSYLPNYILLIVFWSTCICSINYWRDFRLRLEKESPLCLALFVSANFLMATKKEREKIASRSRRKYQARGKKKKKNKNNLKINHKSSEGTLEYLKALDYLLFS